MQEKLLNYWLTQSQKRKMLQDPLNRNTGYYLIKKRLNNGRFDDKEILAYWVRGYNESYGEWVYFGSSEPSVVNNCQQDNLILKKIEIF